MLTSAQSLLSLELYFQQTQLISCLKTYSTHVNKTEINQVSVLTTMEQTRNQQWKKNWKFHKHVGISTILSDKRVTEEIKGKISNILRPKKKNNKPKFMGCNKINTKREV